MKKLLFILAIGFSASLTAQVLTPKASPAAKVQQKVGLADIQIDYSRPGVKGRVIFGDLIPYGQMWRLGANENTKVTTSEALIFGKDTLKAGTYALFAKPGQTNWELYFYADYSNWGLPEPWDAKKHSLFRCKPEILVRTLYKFLYTLEDLKCRFYTTKISKVCPLQSV